MCFLFLLRKGENYSLDVEQKLWLEKIGMRCSVDYAQLILAHASYFLTPLGTCYASRNMKTRYFSLSLSVPLQIKILMLTIFFSPHLLVCIVVVKRGYIYKLLIPYC